MSVIDVWNRFSETLPSVSTLPETNSSPLKMDCLEDYPFLLGFGLFLRANC